MWGVDGASEAEKTYSRRRDKTFLVVAAVNFNFAMWCCRTRKEEDGFCLLRGRGEAQRPIVEGSIDVFKLNDEVHRSRKMSVENGKRKKEEEDLSRYNWISTRTGYLLYMSPSERGGRKESRDEKD